RMTFMTNVVVLGSLNADLVQTIKPLPMPGGTLAGGDLRVIPGGKGASQACTGGRLGGRAAMIGNVGSDPFAAMPLESLRFAGSLSPESNRLAAAAAQRQSSCSRTARTRRHLGRGERTIDRRRCGPPNPPAYTPRIVMCQLEVPMEAT